MGLAAKKSYEMGLSLADIQKNMKVSLETMRQIIKDRDSGISL